MNLSDIVERTSREDFPIPKIAANIRLVISEFVRIEKVPLETPMSRSFAYRLRDIWIWKACPDIEPFAKLQELQISVYYEIYGGSKGQPLRKAVSVNPEKFAGKTLQWFEELINEVNGEDSPVIIDGKVRFSPWYYLPTMVGKDEVFFPISVRRST